MTIAYSDNVNALGQSVSSIQSFVRELSFPALHISLGMCTSIASHLFGLVFLEDYL